MPSSAACPKRNHRGAIFMASPSISHSKSTRPANVGQTVTDSLSKTGDAAAPTLTQAVPSPPREARIATAAYYRAEQRGFAPGTELADWFAAEREVDGR
jgi:hypothetical protein